MVWYEAVAHFLGRAVAISHKHDSPWLAVPATLSCKRTMASLMPWISRPYHRQHSKVVQATHWPPSVCLSIIILYTRIMARCWAQHAWQEPRASVDSIHDHVTKHAQHDSSCQVSYFRPFLGMPGSPNVRSHSGNGQCRCGRIHFRDVPAFAPAKGLSSIKKDLKQSKNH